MSRAAPPHDDGAAAAAPLRVAFGPFVLDVADARLWRDGRPVPLRPKAFDLLRVLVERAGQLTTKDELLDAVWGTRFVTEGVIKTAIGELREALDEDPRRPQWIETVPRRGYRFLAPARAVDAPPHTTAAPSLPAEVAAPTAAVAPSNLPADRSPLYGRTQDIVAVLRLLSEQRLVTLAGPGGIGKTRLAIAVATHLRSRYPDGVWFVDLAALADPEAVAPTIARTVGLAVGPETASADGLSRALRATSLLVVLDNCEHLLGAVGPVADALLRSAPRVTLLVTTQEPLKLTREQVFRLEGLPSPAPADEMRAEDFAAVALFVARVRALVPTFTLDADGRAATVEVCRRLEGIPLALELAAARVPLLGVEGVRSRLDERLRLLASRGRDLPSRHRTLREALAWSHGLLDADERVVFRRLGVFAGSASPEMAQAVVADEALDAWAVLDHLGALVDKSLLQSIGGPARRVQLLETLRAYAREQLDAAGEARTVRARLATALRATFDTWDADYLSTPAFDWLARAEPELNHVREALRWSCGADGDRAVAIGLAGSSVGLWVLLDLVDEAGAWFDAIEPWVDDATPPADAARFWLALAQLGGTGVARSVTPGRAAAAARRAVDRYRALGDPLHQYWSLNFLIPLAERAGEPLDTDAAIAEMRRLVRPDWPPHVGRLLRATEARRLARQGLWPEYRDAFAREVALLEAQGDLRATWLAAQSLALAHMRLGDPGAAVDLLDRVVAQVRERGRLRQAWSLLGLLASAHIERGDTAAATPVVREFVSLVRSVASLAWGIDYLSNHVAQCGRWEDAARLQGWSDAQAAARGETRGPGIREAHARLRDRLRSRFADDALARLLAQGAGLDEDAVAALICPSA